MAKRTYWIDQFGIAAPHFMARWYMEYHGIEACEKVFKTLGTDIAVRAGSYQTKAIGQVVVKEAGSAEFIIRTFEQSDNVIIEDLWYQFSKQLKNGTNQEKLIIKNCLAPLMGETAMDLPWWEERKVELRKLTLDLNKAKKVLES